jgi:hypothetical protein
MTDTVINFGGGTFLDLPPDRVLKAATGKLEGVILLGYDKENNEYFASSYGDATGMLWLVEQFKKRLLETVK